MQAGSERVKDTKAEKGMLKEASSINKSLFTLGKVGTVGSLDLTAGYLAGLGFDPDGYITCHLRIKSVNLDIT